ncbi:Acetyltransferase (GNAT) family [Halanaeroarchaeum sp. HSR-CO]|uniref:GNAT family N-acetyltransferase n=1 Tax=Halanaeroarchaeum sp. HSR-CO TaxID=2866382 RepID=UPI00217DDAD7|nr:GNAT family N-acetyltransferase [Halanaeroarchaeum sp. HSR-CO]UWG47758.1 Acetyltransferase (GNAT) family [Halanaeroarchaeum sp. HSR-CO]
MEFEFLGWPADGPTLELDWRRFSYAGKFVMSNTGKAVAREDGDIVGAIAFNEDRTDDDRCWIRYVTVREDWRGESVGTKLTAFAVNQLLDRYATIRTGANNPFSYQSFYKAGFGFVGETTGLAELVLERPVERSTTRYRAGLRRYADRDLSEPEREFIEAHRDADPPPVIEDFHNA